MVRRTGASRVEGPEKRKARAEATPYPSIRQRRPVLFWFAVLIVAVMVLATISGFLSANL